jgi:hypothetical protein
MPEKLKSEKGEQRIGGLKEEHYIYIRNSVLGHAFVTSVSKIPTFIQLISRTLQNPA